MPTTIYYGVRLEGEVVAVYDVEGDAQLAAPTYGADPEDAGPLTPEELIELGLVEDDDDGGGGGGPINVVEFNAGESGGTLEIEGVSHVLVTVAADDPVYIEVPDGAVGQNLTISLDVRSFAGGAYIQPENGAFVNVGGLFGNDFVPLENLGDSVWLSWTADGWVVRTMQQAIGGNAIFRSIDVQGPGQSNVRGPITKVGAGGEGILAFHGAAGTVQGASIPDATTPEEAVVAVNAILEVIRGKGLIVPPA